MNKISVSLTALCLACGPAFGHSANDDLAQRRISGVPLADLTNNEVSIPCLRVENKDSNTNGAFFDAILEYHPDSRTFSVKYARPEDPNVCSQVAAYAEAVDDDQNDASLGAAFNSPPPNTYGNTPTPGGTGGNGGPLPLPRNNPGNTGGAGSWYGWGDDGRGWDDSWVNYPGNTGGAGSWYGWGDDGRGWDDGWGDDDGWGHE